MQTVFDHATLDPVSAPLEFAVHTGETPVTRVRQPAVTYEKTVDELVVEVGGFGYTPPARFSLTVTDLKNCTEAAELVVAVEDYPVDGAGTLCSSVAVTLPHE